MMTLKPLNMSHHRHISRVVYSIIINILFLWSYAINRLKTSINQWISDYVKQIWNWSTLKSAWLNSATISTILTLVKVIDWILYFRISLGRNKSKLGKWSLLLISWYAPDKVRYQSLKGILWDRRWSTPSIKIFSHTCWFFYRNAFLLMKLSNPPSF